MCLRRSKQYTQEGSRSRPVKRGPGSTTETLSTMHITTYLAGFCGLGMLTYALAQEDVSSTYPLVTASASLLRRITFTNLPTLAPASYCSEVIDGHGVVWHTKTDSICTYKTFSRPATNIGGTWIAVQTGPAMGQHTFAPTTGPPPPPSASNQPQSAIAGNGNGCTNTQKKTTVNGKPRWTDDPYTDPLATCKQFCKPWSDPTKITSSSCIMVGDHWVDEQGHPKSGKSHPLRVYASRLTKSR